MLELHEPINHRGTIYVGWTEIICMICGNKTPNRIIEEVIDGERVWSTGPGFCLPCRITNGHAMPVDRSVNET